METGAISTASPASQSGAWRLCPLQCQKARQWRAFANCYRSPGSGIGVSGSEIADSLRRIFEIFPFSGDWGRRPGSICTAWPSLQCKPALFSAMTARKSGMWKPILDCSS
jgi:hypothetical protein